MSRSLFVIAAISKSGFSSLGHSLASIAPADRPGFLHRELAAMAAKPIPLVASYHAVLEPWHGISRLISLYADDGHPMMDLMRELESNGYAIWPDELEQRASPSRALFNRLSPDDPGHSGVQVLESALQQLSRFAHPGMVGIVATLGVGPSFDDAEFK